MPFPKSSSLWDTLIASWLLEPWRDSHALVVNENAHRADADAEACYDLFEEQIARLAPCLDGPDHDIRSFVDRLYLAGGFANYVNVRNAIAIGLLAPVPEERIVKVGNAAVQGAREILLSRTKRRALERMVQTIEHIELETTPDFFELFVDGCQFKPMPSVLAPDGRAP